MKEAICDCPLCGRMHSPGDGPLWQPINTAPRDGTPILAFGLEWDKPIIAVLRWHAFSAGSIGREQGDSGMWGIVGASGFECECDLQEPTHWMSLPGAPLQIL